MKYGTSLRTRHLVGRLDKGEEVIDALTQLCIRERIRAGTFHALGILSSAQLQTFDTDQRQHITFFSAERTFEVISLTGNISTLGDEIILHATASLADLVDGQLRVVAGHFKAGRVLICEFAITAYDDLKLARTFDPITQQPLWNRIQALQPNAPVDPPSSARASATPDNDDQPTPDDPAPVEPDDLAAVGVHIADAKSTPQIIRRGATPTPAAEDPEPSPPADTQPAGKQAWAAAINTSQALKTGTLSPAQVLGRQPDPEPDSSPLDIPEGARPERPARVSFDNLDELDDEIRAGDVLVHPQFGRCTVARVESEDAVHIRMRGKRTSRKLLLRIFELNRIDDEDDHRVFELVRKRSR